MSAAAVAFGYQVAWSARRARLGSRSSVDRSLGVQDGGKRPFIEDDQHDRRPGAGVGKLGRDCLAGAGRASTHPTVEHEECRYQNRGDGRQQGERADATESDVGPAHGGAGGQRKHRGKGRGKIADRLQGDYRDEQTYGSCNRRSHPGWAKEPKCGAGRREHQRRDDSDHHDQSQKVAHVEVADSEELGRLPQQVVDRLGEGKAAQAGNGENAGDEAPIRLSSSRAGGRVRG